MRKFARIETIAAERKGGPKALEGLLSKPLGALAVARKAPSVWLEAMTKAIFQAGFNWQVIEAKWPGFQTAFQQFDPVKIALWTDDDLDRLLQDKRIVRNGGKIEAVFENARFLQSLDRETGNVSRHLARWPVEDQIGLMALLAKRGARLGGVTGQRVCRALGRDTYVLSTDVVKRLMIEEVIDGPPTSRAALARVQDAFNQWHRESGRPMTQISQILAMSVD